MNALLVMFEEHFQAPKQLPLYEAFYFDQVTSLEQHLSPSPQASIQTALNNPAHYLDSASEGGREDQTISSRMPDICILYQLHLECGKLINLYDWLQVQ